MKLHLYSIFDAKASAFNTPFGFTTPGQALRAFNDLANDPQSSISKHPEDYQLWHIGTFDQDTGHLQADDVKSVANATDFTNDRVNAVPLSIKR